MEIRIVFMGSPDFAVPTLETLAEAYSVVGVVTQPDRLAGRGRKQFKSPAVKSIALELGLPVIQPTSLRREPDAVAQIRAWKPDVIVVSAYGQILRSEVLELPLYGCLNVHASLLPRWRGAAPINAAILNGDTETGISIMQMDAGMDTGPILTQLAVPIEADETAGTLFQKLSSLGAQLLLDTLPKYINGEIEPIPQIESLVTYAPMLKKADGELDFQKSAIQLALQVRAFNPWPGSYIHWKGNILKIHQASPGGNDVLTGIVIPGGRYSVRGYPAIGTAEGLLLLEILQPAGKRKMAGKEFLQGARDWT